MGVEVLGFEILTSPATCFLKVCSGVNIFFFTSDFRFHPSSSLTPIDNCLLGFFLSSFISQLFVFLIKPKLFKLLLVSQASWIIELIVAPSFKAILFVELSWLVGSEENLERMGLCRFLNFFKFAKAAN
jgi:hypothetical protein